MAVLCAHDHGTVYLSETDAGLLHQNSKWEAAELCSSPRQKTLLLYLESDHPGPTQCCEPTGLSYSMDIPSQEHRQDMKLQVRVWTETPEESDYGKWKEK